MPKFEIDEGDRWTIINGLKAAADIYETDRADCLRRGESRLAKAFADQRADVDRLRAVVEYASTIDIQVDSTDHAIVRSNNGNLRVIDDDEASRQSMPVQGREPKAG